MKYARWIIGLLVFVALVVVGVIVFGLNGSDKEPNANASKDKSERERCEESVSWLDVVEHGWSVTDDSEASKGYIQISFGGLLQNTSKTELAQSAKLGIRFLDESGEEVPRGGGAESEKVPEATQSWSDVNPGETVAVTGYVNLAEEPADIELDLRRVCHMSESKESFPAIEVTASTLSMDGGILSAKLDVNSSFDAEKNGIVCLVFRDSQQDVIGGAPLLSDVGGSETEWPGVMVEPGESQIQVEFEISDYVSPHVELENTTVLVET